MADGTYRASTNSGHGRYPGMTTLDYQHPSDSQGPVRIFRNHVWIKLLYYNYDEIKNGTVKTAIDQAVVDDFITQRDLTEKKIVFDSLMEGHGPREIKSLYQSLGNESWFDINRVVWLHQISDPLPPEIKNVKWDWYMVDHGAWLSSFKKLNIDCTTLQRTHDFICLMRRRSQQRAWLARDLYINFVPGTFFLSYASMIDYTEYDPIVQSQLPILLDGHTRDTVHQHRASDPRIFGCLINVIAETSNQEPEQYGWCSQFVTEKTYKCFGWHQIPIWWTVPGLVDIVRKQGFDVFDDVMEDHHYDSIQDPSHRRNTMVSILKRAIAKISEEGRQRFNDRMMPRFVNNFNRLDDMYVRKLGHWPEILKNVDSI